MAFLYVFILSVRKERKMSKNLKIDIEDKDVIFDGYITNIHGKVLKEEIPYKVVSLTKADIQTMMIFQQIILDSLKDDEKSFFLEKSESYLTSHFNKGSKAIAVVADGCVVGQALLVHPTEENPETGMTDMDLDASPDSISVIQGVGVHPAARGFFIGDKLIKAWMSVAKNDNRPNVIAETEQNNIYSWRLFVNNGVDIVSEAVDPSDGAQLYNHHKVLKL